MKNKKLLIGLIAGIVILAAAVTGILLLSGGNENNDPTVNTGANAEVTISQTKAEIGVGGKLYLTAEAKNTQEPILWASSDPSVASVKNGEVTGLKEGTTIISASAGTAVAECTVIVSMDAPVLVLNQEYVAVSIGGSYTLQAEVRLNGKAYTEAVTYQWTGSENSEAVVKLEPSADGSSAVVTGVAYGETEYFVTTTVKGVTLTKRVTVVCCNTDITFQASGEGIEPAVGGFDANVELGTSVQPVVTVFNKEQIVENPQFTWTTEDENVATVTADGKITGVAEGYTVVTCKYGEENNYVKFFVNVYRPAYTMDTHYDVETAVGSLTVTDKLAGTIKGATLDGVSIFASANGNTVSFKADALPTDPEVMGEGRVLVIHTTRAQYVYTVGVYSKVITTAEQLQNMAKYLIRSEGDNNWAQYTGYIVLGKDIDLAGAAFEMFIAEPWSGDKGGDDNNINSGFNGIFDGRGFSIKNYTATAGNNTLFTVVGKGGMIQNVSFLDISAPATAGNILTRILNGGMKDVYISVKSWESGSLLAHSYRDGRFMENVVIEYTGPAIEGTRDVTGCWGTPPTYFPHYPTYIKNVYVIGNITTIETNCAEHGDELPCGFHVYQSWAQAIAAGNDYSSFCEEFWNISSGAPIPESIYNARANQDITIENKEKLVSAGDVITLRANVDHVTWSLVQAPKGVTLKGNVVTIGDKAEQGAVKIVATNIYNSSKKATYTCQVVEMTQEKLSSVGDLELNGIKGQTTVTLDLSKATAFTKVEGIKIGDKEIPVESVSGAKVTIATEHLKSFLGKNVDIVLTCKIADGYSKVTIPAFVVSKVLKTADDIQNMADFTDRSEGDNNWAQYTGYLVLGKDIDLAGASFELFVAETWTDAEGGDQNKANMGFNGTLDGRGHSIKNYVATAGNNTLFTVVGKNGMIQNVSFLDISAPATAGNILTRILNGSMKDVYISVKSWESGSLLAHSYRDGRFLENVVIEYTGAPIEGVRDVTGCWGTPPTYFVHAPAHIQNVYVIGNITTIETNCAEHADEVCGFHIYKNLAEMKADNNDYSGFSKDFWNLDSGVPTPETVYKERTECEITVTNTEKIISAGDVITLMANVDHVTWTLGKAPAGVTLKGNVLTVGQGAGLGQVQVIATNVYNTAKKATYSFQVVSMTNEKLASVGELELNDSKGQTTVTLDLSKATAFTKVEGIKIGNKEIPVGSVSGAKVTVATEYLKQFLGKDVEIQITCKTATGYNKVTVPAYILSKVLETAEDIQNMADYMDRTEGDNNWTQYTGYLVLGKDIDLAGASFELFVAETWTDAQGGDQNKANMGFNGTLDGRGHVLKNYTATAGHNALFTMIGKAGLIQNLSLTDITAPGTAGNILTRIFNGTMKDVYISLKTWDNGALLAHSYRDGRFMENVVIEYTGPAIDGLRDVTGHWGDANYFVHFPSNLKNVYVVGNINTVMTNCQEHNADGEDDCGFHVYKTLADMKAAGNDYSGFSTKLWNTTIGIPVPQFIYAERAAADITVSNSQTTAAPGETVSLEANVPYVSWTLNTAPSGVTLQGNRLTVAENAEKGTVTVTATNLFNTGKTATYSFKVIAMTEQTLSPIGDLELNKTSGQTAVTLDLSGANAYTTVEGIKIGEVEIPVTGQSGTTVTVNTQSLKPFLGQNVEFAITCKTGEDYNKVTVSAFILSKIVTGEDELDQLASFMDDINGDGTEYQGYIALGNDITCTEQLARQFYYAEIAGTNVGFNGTFDGRGFVIRNMTPDNQGFISTLGEKGIICNVSFLDVNTVGNNKYNLAFTRYSYGKMQDVYISMNNWTEASLFLNGNGNWINLERVVIVAENATADHLVFCDPLNERNTLVDVHFVGGMSVNFKNEDVKGGNNIFTQSGSLAELKANITPEQAEPFSGASFWNTQCGMPVPAKLFAVWSATDVTVTNDKVGDHYEINKGSVMELGANVPYVQWTLVGNTDSKITLVGNQLTVPTDATATQVVLKVTNLYNDAKSVQITVQITSSTEKTLTQIADLELMATAGQTHVYIDLEETNAVTHIIGVTVNGNAAPAGTFALEGGKLKLAVDQLQAYLGQSVTLEIAYKTADANVTATCQVGTVVTKVIRTFADLSVLNSNTTPNLTGYYVLGNDIDADGQTVIGGSTPGWANTGFQGIFDGRNHAISNLNMDGGSNYAGIFGNVSGGTIKNITFDNVVYTYRASLFGRFMANKAGTNQKTTIENVTVNVTGWGTNVDEAGIFSSKTMANTRFINVVVNVADGITVTTLLGNNLNTSNVEGDVTVNLGVGSSITYYHDASTVKPDFVTVNQEVAQEITEETIIEGNTMPAGNHLTDGAVTVTIGGTVYNGTVAGGQLTVTGLPAATGKLDNAIVEQGDKTYTYTNIWHVTQVIDNATELKALGTACKNSVVTGYYILGDNIDCSAEATMSNGSGNTTANGFAGTFDGRGLTISNIKMTWDSATSGLGGLFGKLQGATIKNTVFDNVNLGTNGTLLASGAAAYNGSNVNLKNLTINLTGYTTGYGVVVGYSMLNTITDGIVINVADGLTVTALLCRDNCNSITYVKATVNLGVGSTITNYYGNVTAKPDTITVNTARVPTVAEVDTLVAGEASTGVTFTHDLFADCATATVVINEQTRTVDITGGTITVDLADYGVNAMGQYEAVITTNAGDVLTFKEVWYVTQVIDNVAELKALGAACKAANTTGYYILGGNIDCSAEANMAAGNPGWQKNGFSGTFDGRGYTISNIKMTWDSATGGYGGFFGNLAGCTIQNVVFDKVNYASVNVSLFGRHSYASGGNNVNLKNLTVNVSGWGATGTNEAGVLLSKNMQNTIATNVVVNVADGLTINTLLGADCSSIAYVTMTVNLGAGSTITNYYGTTTVKPDTITVNTTGAPSAPVVEQIDTLVAGEKTTSVTFLHDSFVPGDATVTVNEQTKTVAVSEAGKLTVDLAEFGVSNMGKYSAVIVQGQNQLTYTEVWYVTQVIDDATELKALGTSCKNGVVTGYYILGGNIDCSGYATMSNGSASTTTNGFQGTFDGRGLTISNITMTWDSATSGLGGLFGKLLGCTIQDTTFDNVNLGTNGTLLASGADKNTSTNVNTTLKNLTVNLTGYTTTYGVVVGYSMFNTVTAGNGLTFNVASGLTVKSLLCRDTCNSIAYITGTVNLGSGSSITYYYSTVSAKPATFTVNTAAPATAAVTPAMLAWRIRPSLMG